MNLSKGKAATTVFLILAITFAVLPTSIQFASAQNQIQIDTFGYLTVVPNPVGVGQQTIITFGIDKTSPVGNIRGGNWEGLVVKIIRPDNVVETLGPQTAYSMANFFWYYTPSIVGNYTIEGTFPGQWINGSYRGITERGQWSNSSSYGATLQDAAWWFKPCNTIMTLVVTEEQIPQFPNIPLPTEVWARPLNGEIKDWWTIADNWLMPKYDESSAWRFSTAAFAPYTSAPDSPHVLWKRPVTFGGVAGGPYGDESYRTGLSYEPFYSYSLVLNGRILYDEHGPATSNVYGTRCIDLRTGEDIFYLEDVNIDFAQILKYDSGNEHGPMCFLWETTSSAWYMYDAFTGKLIHTINNMNGLTGTNKLGPNGEILSWRVTGDSPNRQMTLWNSTLALVGEQSDYFSPRYEGTSDGRDGIQWNVTIPSNAYDINRIQAISVEEGYVLTVYTDHTVFPHIMAQECWPAFLNQDSSGNYPTTMNPLWVEERSMYTEREGYTNIRDGVFAIWDQGKRQYYGYSIKTGDELWKTDPVPMGWGIFTAGSWIAYGKLYSGFFDGHIRAWDVTNGEIVWDFYMGDTPYMETAYGSLPAYGFTIADGKVFVSNDEHSPDSVLWRGGRLWALNAETGELEWSISGRLRQATVADGVLTAFNLYDNQIWSFGKGPSKTTVSAPQTQVNLGESVMITGTVTDQTPSSKDTPAVSEESMAAWMEYLHMQKPFPSEVTGVTVTISVLDANNNYYDIGNAITDASGAYNLWWEPPIPGEFKIVATFAGSNSYGSSFAQTAMGVGEEAPVATPEPPASMTDTYVTGFGIGIIIAIVVVGLLVFLMLRKR